MKICSVASYPFQRLTICTVILLANVSFGSTGLQDNYVKSLWNTLNVGENEFLKGKVRAMADGIPNTLLASLAVSFENDDPVMGVGDVADVGYALYENNYDYQTLLELSMFTKPLRNRARILRKAAEFAPREWWTKSFIKENLGQFELLKIIGFITDRHRYRYSFYAFKLWLKSKADYLQNKACSESAMMIALEYEAERLIPFESQDEFSRMFEVMCRGNERFWKAFLDTDEMRKAEPEIVLALMEKGEQLVRDMKGNMFERWPAPAVASAAALCRDGGCVGSTAAVVRRSVAAPYLGMTPDCLALVRRTAARQRVGRGTALAYLGHFLQRARRAVAAGCDQAAADAVVAAFQVQEAQDTGFLARPPTSYSGSMLCDGVQRVLELAQEHGWESADQLKLLLALKTANIPLHQHRKVLEVKELTEADEYVELLDIFLHSGREDLSVRQSGASSKVDMKAMVALSRSGGPVEKLTVRMFFQTAPTSLSCGTETVRALVPFFGVATVEPLFRETFALACRKGDDKVLPLLRAEASKHTALYQLQKKLKEIA